MDVLKKVFPFSFKNTKTVSDLIIGILIYLVAGIVAGAIIWLATMLTGWIPGVGPLIGWLIGIIATLAEIYVIAGIVLLILAFLKIIK